MLLLPVFVYIKSMATLQVFSLSKIEDTQFQDYKRVGVLAPGNTQRSLQREWAFHQWEISLKEDNNSQ